MGRWGGDLGGVGGRKSVIRIHAMKEIQYKRKRIHNNVIKVDFYLAYRYIVIIKTLLMTESKPNQCTEFLI